MATYKRGKAWYVRLEIAGKQYKKSLGRGSTRHDAIALEARIRREVTGMRKARPIAGAVSPPKTKTASTQYLYRYYDDRGGLLYVGISISAVLRLLSHKSRAPWYEEICTVKIARYATREEVRAAERDAILNESPQHNVAIPVERPPLKSFAHQIPIDGLLNKVAKKWTTEVSLTSAAPVA
jgi:hypothetical protein